MADITAELTSGTTVRIATDRHTWQADEPPGIGADAGPTPYELVLGGLAACVCITISLYCQRKGWRLDNVSVEYQYDRVHADDCDDCEADASGYLDRVRGRVFVDGDFDDAQRARLQEIAVRCPVHKTLERGVSFSEEEILVA